MGPVAAGLSGGTRAASPAVSPAPGGYNPSVGVSTLRPLRELRHDRGLSIRGLETAAGVNRAVISQIERGRLVATAEEADRLDAALDLPAGALRTYTVLATEQAAAPTSQGGT